MPDVDGHHALGASYRAGMATVAHFDYGSLDGGYDEAMAVFAAEPPGVALCSCGKLATRVGCARGSGAGKTGMVLEAYCGDVAHRVEPSGRCEVDPDFLVAVDGLWVEHPR